MTFKEALMEVEDFAKVGECMKNENCPFGDLKWLILFTSRAMKSYNERTITKEYN